MGRSCVAEVIRNGPEKLLWFPGITLRMFCCSCLLWWAPRGVQGKNMPVIFAELCTQLVRIWLTLAGHLLTARACSVLTHRTTNVFGLCPESQAKIATPPSFLSSFARYLLLCSVCATNGCHSKIFPPFPLMIEAKHWCKHSFCSKGSLCACLAQCNCVIMLSRRCMLAEMSRNELEIPSSVLFVCLADQFGVWGSEGEGSVCVYPFLGFVCFSVRFRTALLRNTLRNYFPGIWPASML